MHLLKECAKWTGVMCIKVGWGKVCEGAVGKALQIGENPLFLGANYGKMT